MLRISAGVVLFLSGCLGIIGAAYTGLWLMFIGGIIEVIDGAKATPTDSTGIAYGIVRVILASPVGGILFWLSALVAGGGLYMMGQKKDSYFRYKIR